MEILTKKTIHIKDNCYLCQKNRATVLVSVLIDSIKINMPVCSKCLNEPDLEQSIKKTVEG